MTDLDSLQIQNDYANGLTQKQIADKYGVARNQIQKIFKINNIQARNCGHKVTTKAKKGLNNPRYLNFLHWHKKLTLKNIADILSLKSTVAVLSAMKRFDIPYRMSHQEHLTKEQVLFRKDPQNIISLNQNLTLQEIADQTGYTKGHISNIFSYNNIDPIIHKVERSSWEQKISDFLCKHTQVQLNKKDLIPPFEIDIFLPQHKIAIECNGVYWHSSEHVKSDYHLKKTNLCEQMGVRLYHLNCYDYRESSEKIIRFLHQLIDKSEFEYARRCEIELISNEVCRSFYDEYHIQNSPPLYRDSINIGLTRANELLCVMTFGKCRFNRNYEWELIRFASKKRVIGGASKILSYFEKNFSPKSIISYAEKTISHGNLYHKLGFIHQYDTKPDYKYVVNGKLIHRQQFQKSKLKQKFPDLYSDSLTEEEILRKAKIFRYYGCGNMVFTKMYDI